MAYLEPIPSKQCKHCRKPATHRVFNQRNEAQGDYCLTHAQDEVSIVNESDQLAASL